MSPIVLCFGFLPELKRHHVQQPIIGPQSDWPDEPYYPSDVINIGIGMLATSDE